MPAYLRSGGASRPSDAVSVYSASAWRTVYQAYVYTQGNWRPLWAYSWAPSAWGSCSASCGGGSQTRTIICRNNRGGAVPNGFCRQYAGNPPVSSQTCNTHGCTECRYHRGDGYFAQTTNHGDWHYRWAGAQFQSTSYNGCRYWGSGQRETGPFGNKYYNICHCCPSC